MRHFAVPEKAPTRCFNHIRLRRARNVPIAPLLISTQT